MSKRPSDARPRNDGPILHGSVAGDRARQSINDRINCRPKKRCRVWILALLVIVFQTGCSGASLVGLVPEYPPVKIKMFSLYSEYVEVDSLQPELRWQPLRLSPEAFATDDNASMVKIENIIYELRVWNTTAGRSGKLVYARKDLTQTVHRLERPLEPGSRYLWSIRAHFLLDGRPRAIEWSMAGYAHRNEAVPNESCLRFQTPPAP